MKVFTLLIIFAFSIISCNKKVEFSEDNTAKEFVKLCFQLGEYDKDFVDAYFGPDDLKEEAQKNKISLSEIQVKANDLIANIEVNAKNSPRMEHLSIMLRALATRAEMMESKVSFKRQCEEIYTVNYTEIDINEFDQYLEQLDKLLPGEGELAQRVLDFKSQFIIPKENLKEVFTASINEARRRVAENMQLPELESFVVEYVKDVPWGAYNWFKGNSYSLIQVNTDLPIYIDRAIDLACHEGYPGHHVYHSTLEEKLVKEKNWIEYSIYPLFSPQSVISEGLANYGIEVVFPKEEKIQFEKEVLFPLAGLDTNLADKYHEIIDLNAKLGRVSMYTAQKYLDGEITREEAVKLLVKYQLKSGSHANTNLDFYEKYSAYIITYFIGEELVRKHVEDRIKADNSTNKWEVYKQLLSSPISAKDL